MKDSKRKPRVAFVCVHNSCRSQIAEALAKQFANEVFESYSAGTEVKAHINQDATRLVKQKYGIDMERNQFSKLWSTLPPIDIVITMGCNVSCPMLTCGYQEDWGLEDPSGKEDAEFMKTIERIDKNIVQLKERIENNQLTY